jgi:(4S)-4-hydroxy-5-phosphonooxypentane-2,3-dione isomerase
MYVTLVHVQVKPEHVADFTAACRENHLASVREAGNRRFDVLQLTSDPTKFVLYEAYVGADDAAAHKQTPHYIQWRDRVASWMASPRQGVNYVGLFPVEDHG